LFFEVAEEAALADVDDESSAVDSLLVVVGRHEAAERRDHGDGEVVDAEVTEILEGVGGGGHSGTAQAGDDYDVRDVVFLSRRGVFRFAGHLDERQLYHCHFLFVILERLVVVDLKARGRAGRRCLRP